MLCVQTRKFVTQWDRPLQQLLRFKGTSPEWVISLRCVNLTFWGGHCLVYSKPSIHHFIHWSVQEWDPLKLLLSICWFKSGWSEHIRIQVGAMSGWMNWLERWVYSVMIFQKTSNWNKGQRTNWHYVVMMMMKEILEWNSCVWFSELWVLYAFTLMFYGHWSMIMFSSQEAQDIEA